MMKPYISVLYERGNKTYKLPVNPKYRELLDCAAALGLKSHEDESNLYEVNYQALFSPKPSVDDDWRLVNETDKRLGELSPAQAEAVYALCRLFGLKFSGVLAVIKFAEALRKEQDDEDN